MVTAPNKGARSGRRGRRKRRLPMSDINVTPFVDVMLVLLVVFMVTAPLLTVGVPVDLPKAQASLIQEPDEPLSVSIDFEGRVYVQDSEIALRKLTARLIAVTGANPDIRIFVRGDKTIDYGRVMQVMGTINAAGFKRVALIT
ncbi:MAG TPA: protein TolR, partial [Rhodospirillales bacterium]|nr:protein TolR [Rhodospirillales bacterium]